MDERDSVADKLKRFKFQNSIEEEEEYPAVERRREDRRQSDTNRKSSRRRDDVDDFDNADENRNDNVSDDESSDKYEWIRRLYRKCWKAISDFAILLGDIHVSIGRLEVNVEEKLKVLKTDNELTLKKLREDFEEKIKEVNTKHGELVSILWKSIPYDDPKIHHQQHITITKDLEERAIKEAKHTKLVDDIKTTFVKDILKWLAISSVIVFLAGFKDVLINYLTKPNNTPQIIIQKESKGAE